MQHFRHKVAVITGAASGIGRALARRFAFEGMRVVLADVNADALSTTAAELQRIGAEVLAVPTDVPQARDIEALADRTVCTFGAVHLLCNNAGVGIATPILDSMIPDWE
jgi:NADP-dependent 3-hydroxy acid dehydrogenase YdfG